MKQATLVILVAALLAGCAAELKGPSVEVKSPLVQQGHGHGFCPPGQAKKGNC
jgi:hypothetical protein